jgi:hypothetical protein
MQHRLFHSIVVSSALLLTGASTAACFGAVVPGDEPAATPVIANPAPSGTTDRGDAGEPADSGNDARADAAPDADTGIDPTTLARCSEPGWPTTKGTVCTWDNTKPIVCCSRGKCCVEDRR